MAHYNITHACGHTSRPDIIGPYKSREQRIADAEDSLCAACVQAEKQKRTEEARAHAEGAGLVRPGGFVAAGRVGARCPGVRGGVTGPPLVRGPCARGCSRVGCTPLFGDSGGQARSA
ncbi:hypothetical protein GCM10010505_77140 [Kitasatospora aburaviensis]